MISDDRKEDRRIAQRRGVVAKVEEPLERDGDDRRYHDRRDSPRVPLSLRVRGVGGSGELESRDGNISLGGAFWETWSPVPWTDLEVRFRLPNADKELSAIAEVVRLSRLEGNAIGVHARFVVIDVEAELELARYLEATTRLVKVARPDLHSAVIDASQNTVPIGPEDWEQAKPTR
jgi:hypothetical protein